MFYQGCQVLQVMSEDFFCVFLADKKAKAAVESPGCVLQWEKPASPETTKG